MVEFADQSRQQPRIRRCAVRGWLFMACLWPVFAAATGMRFEVAVAPTLSGEAQTGRLIVAVAAAAQATPLDRIGLDGAAIFGVDVEGLKPGQKVVVDASADAYPMSSLDRLPAGDYDVQAVLVRYTEIKRADGHTLWLPLAERRIPFHAKPGNFKSAVKRVTVQPKSGSVALTLDTVIPKLAPLKDSDWIKHVRVESKILSDHWGKPISVGASVLLPKGFHENPDANYPVVYVFGHGYAPFGFSTDPSGQEAARVRALDANIATGYEFFQAWNSDDFPRFIAVTFEHPSPYFVESYAIDSANNGPFGQAFTKEVMPAVERQFRAIGQPYARFVEGASTGGWEALALQLHYPDYFGGAWVFNPDPIDLRRYVLSDIYADANMFTMPRSAWQQHERLFRRSREGQPLVSMRELAQFEAVLGSRGRSGYQLDIWQATHGPVGADGYPALLFDKKTGVIDRQVAAWTRDHGYDLSAYARANWATLAPKLAGKLNLIAGEMDDFHLNLSVYEFEAMLRETAGADYPARFVYGRPKKGHNWHHTDWAGVLGEMADQARRQAPAGSDSSKWDHRAKTAPKGK